MEGLLAAKVDTNRFRVNEIRVVTPFIEKN
jgi:hypothetical protein